MRITALQRIKSPGHLPDSHRQGALALSLLQPRPQVQMPVSIQHGQHMRVNNSRPVLASHESESESNQPVLIVKRAHKNISRRPARNRQRQRQNILVRQSPDFLFHRLQLCEVFNTLDVTNPDLATSNVSAVSLIVLLQFCHLERSFVIGEADDKVKSKDPIPVNTTPSQARRSHEAAIPAPRSAHPNHRATLKPETDITVKRTTFLYPIVLITLALTSPLHAAERGTIVREAIIYLSPDTSSNKLGQIDRGRELILLDRSRNWLHVEALLGTNVAPDPAFVLEEEDEGKTISGWIIDTGIVWSTTPNGDRILFGAAVDSEEEAGRRHGRRSAAQEALRLYHRVYDIFPAAPDAGEALYRAADIKWQVDRADMLSRPSAREKDPMLRYGIAEEGMKQVMKKFPDSKWAQLAAFHLIDNKLCGDWQGSSKCPDKEAEMYEKYVKEHPQSPAAPEALYNAASRRAALIEIYKTEEQPKKSEQSKSAALALAQELIAQYPQSDWSSRGQTLLFLVQQAVPTYGNAIQ